MLGKSKKLSNELSIFQKVINYLFLTALFLLMFLPLWNVFIISTSTALQASTPGIRLWWDGFSVEGYLYILRIAKLKQPFVNSLFITLTGSIIQMILSSMAGYVLIQQDIPFKKLITSFIMLTMMIPGDLTLVSIYQLNKNMGLLNSYTGLILNGLISGFSILLMRNYFMSVPSTLAESARVEGASEFRIFSNIYLPISLPGLSTVFFLEFVARWNSIMIPATLTSKQKYFTLPLVLKKMIIDEVATSGTAQAPDNAVMAAIVISTIPLLLIYVFAQQFLLSGMTLGASKE